MRYARLADQLRYEESVDMGVAASWPQASRAAERYFRARANDMLPSWALAEDETALPRASSDHKVIEISSWEALKAWAPRRKKILADG